MPGQYRWSLDLLLKEIEHILQLGIKSICLFPVIENSKKDTTASEGINPDGLYPKAIEKIKKHFHHWS